MSIAIGAKRFFAWKAQTAHGTKASGFTTSVAPLRSGSIFKVNPILQARADAINTMLRFADYYPVPRVLPWQASFYIQNPTTAHSGVRDFLRSFFGKETTAAGPPLTKRFDISDPVIDGGTDGTPANVLYGRDITLHEESQTSAGAAIYADEAQDAVVENFKITWMPDAPLLFELSGLCSDLKGGQTTITPSYPDGNLFHWQHTRDPTTSGLRIGAANPLTSADNVIASKVVLVGSQKIRYLPFIGNGTTKQVRLPVRDDQVSITLEVDMDVEDAIASQYESLAAQADWEAPNAVNLDFLTFLDANNILEYSATAATKSCFWESFEKTAQGYGAQAYHGVLRVVPNALTDEFLKFTTVS